MAHQLIGAPIKRLRQIRQFAYDHPQSLLVFRTYPLDKHVPYSGAQNPYSGIVLNLIWAILFIIVYCLLI